jgi:hypothetical protein
LAQQKVNELNSSKAEGRQGKYLLKKQENGRNLGKWESNIYDKEAQHRENII